MPLYKLTDTNGKSYNNTQWGENITHTLPLCVNPQLRTKDVIHAYTNINLVFLNNPITESDHFSLLWEANGEIVVSDGLLVGCSELTTIKQIKKPLWVESKNDKKVRIAFAILCVKAVSHLIYRSKQQDTNELKIKGILADLIHILEEAVCLEAKDEALYGKQIAIRISRGISVVTMHIRDAFDVVKQKVDIGVLADRAVKMVTETY